jgi:hypothetical protein
MKNKWRNQLRLWGKKRGGRMSGWWFIGSLGEASFFASFFLVGVLSATTLVAWQLMSPNTQIIRVGYGFWLFFLVAISFIVIGTVGFWYRVLTVVTSDEHREVIAKRGIVPEPMVRKNKNTLPPTVPDLRLFTDSPGAKLAFRLPSQIPENEALVAMGIFAMAWNAMIAMFVVFAIESFFRSTVPYRLLILLVPGIYVAVRSTQLFFRSFIRTLGIGSTTVEVEDLPLIPGNSYQLEVLQYGRLVIRKISVRLVCEEESTYHFGTDLRTERKVVFNEVIAEHGRDRIDWGYPLRMEFQFTVPRDAMHSFQSFHNAIHWKIVVDGKANRWPSYSRNFPVVVYPASPRNPATVAS